MHSFFLLVSANQAQGVEGRGHEDSWTEMCKQVITSQNKMGCVPTTIEQVPTTICKYGPRNINKCLNSAILSRHLCLIVS